MDAFVRILKSLTLVVFLFTSILFPVAGMLFVSGPCFVKDPHRKKTPSNKIPALTKSMNMSIWVVGASIQLLIRGSQTETKFSKKIK